MRDQPRRRARLLAVVAIAALTVYLTAAALLRMQSDPGLEQAFQTVALFYLVPGAIVVLRRDGHLIGWLLMAGGLFWAVQLNSEIPDAGLAWLPLPWLTWLGSWVGYAQWAATVALFVLFPDGLKGRPRRPRGSAHVILAVVVLATVAGMVTDPVAIDTLGQQFPNPTGLGLLPLPLSEFLILPVLAAALAAVAGLWLRARRLTGPAGKQHRWVLFAFIVVVVGLVLGLSFGELVGDIAWLPIVTGWFLIPTAFSIAILRYRLYDIDRIVSRTVSYAVVTAVVVAIYVVPVVVLPALFDVPGPLPVAAATLAAAAAFSPVRRVVQRGVDRHFNREAFDARRELDAFAGRLRSEVELDAIAADMSALVGATLHPSVVTLWIRPARRGP